MQAIKHKGGQMSVISPKQPMTMGYLLVFIFSIIMFFWMLALAGLKVSTSGIGGILWGYTVYGMYQRKNNSLLSIWKGSNYVLFAISILVTLYYISLDRLTQYATLHTLGYNEELLFLSLFITNALCYGMQHFFKIHAEDDEERLRQIAGESARSSMKAPPVQPNFRYGTFAEKSPHNQSDIGRNRSPNISNPEPNPINKDQFPKNQSLSGVASSGAVPETPITSSINQDFEKAVIFFPHLRPQYDSLKNFGPEAQETFATLVVEQKMFQDSAAILQTVEVSELQKLFGANETLQAYGKKLIRDGRKDDVKELGDTIRVMGNTVDPEKIIEMLNSKRRILSQEIKQLSALILQYQNRKANNRTETRKAYLAVLSDKKIVGWNPNTDLYEMFASYEDFARKTNLLVGKFFICEEESDRLKFIDAAGSIKIPTNMESQSGGANVSTATPKIDMQNLYDESIQWLSSYSTIIRTKTGKTEPLRIYLAKIADGRIVGYNTDSFRYEFFKSTIEYSEKTKVHHGHFSISSKKQDREDFLKQVKK